MKSIDEIATIVVDASFKVHQELGPGLLESTYEACLAHELTKRGLIIENQKSQPVFYDGITIDVGYRMDLLVNECIVIELKAVDQIIPIHQAQLMTYLKLSKKLSASSSISTPPISNQASSASPTTTKNPNFSYLANLAVQNFQTP